MLQQCLQAACSDTVRMSTTRKVEVFKDTPLPDTPLIFSIQTLPLHTNTPSPCFHIPSPTLPLHPLPLNLCTTFYCISLFHLPFPPPLPSPTTSLSSSSFWLFSVVTFSTTFSSSSSWEVAQNLFKCCKSKSIYHNHLSLTVRISYAMLKDTLTHTNTQTAGEKKEDTASLAYSNALKKTGALCSERQDF